MGATELAYFLRWRIYLQHEVSEAKSLAIADVKKWEGLSEEFKSECIGVIEKF